MESARPAAMRRVARNRRRAARTREAHLLIADAILSPASLPVALTNTVLPLAARHPRLPLFSGRARATTSLCGHNPDEPTRQHRLSAAPPVPFALSSSPWHACADPCRHVAPSPMPRRYQSSLPTPPRRAGCRPRPSRCRNIRVATPRPAPMTQPPAGKRGKTKHDHSGFEGWTMCQNRHNK